MPLDVQSAKPSAKFPQTVILKIFQQAFIWTA